MSTHPGPGAVSMWPDWRAKDECVLPAPQPLLSAAFLCPCISGLCYSHPCSSRLCHLALARGLV